MPRRFLITTVGAALKISTTVSPGDIPAGGKFRAATLIWLWKDMPFRVQMTAGADFRPAQDTIRTHYISNFDLPYSGSLTTHTLQAP